MSDGDDWFERALRDLDDEAVEDGEPGEPPDEDGRSADAASADGSAESPGGDDESAEPAETTSDTVDPTPEDAGVTTETGDDRSPDPGTGGDEREPGDVGDETDPFGGPADRDSWSTGGRSGGGPDESDDTTPTGDEAESTGDDADPFGGRSDPFGDRSPRQDGADFDPSDFRDLGGRGQGVGDEAFGFGEEDGDIDRGPNDGSEFDEEAFDSDVDRIDVGIRGLDEMILGGVPERSLMVTIGSAGTGKTTFGLQFLAEALRGDGNAVYITLEESREAILSTAEEKGWPFREWCEEGRLAVVALDPIEMANSLSSIRSDISRLVTEFGADRLVLDSVSLLEMMYDHPATRRSEVFDFARSLKEAGVTTMLTSEASDDNPYTSRYGIVEYLVDAVFILQYVRPSDFRETRLAVEIQKIRDANHSRETKPYEITNEGISVYRQANIF